MGNHLMNQVHAGDEERSAATYFVNRIPLAKKRQVFVGILDYGRIE